jgi:hypothetical protein
MKWWQRSAAGHAARVRPTAGDFPHTRRRSLRLACCTCTCCCFTFLLGGIGGVTGLVMGLVKACRTPTGIENPLAALAVRFVRLVIFMAAYGIAGLLIGAAVGFGIDTILGVW